LRKAALLFERELPQEALNLTPDTIRVLTAAYNTHIAAWRENQVLPDRIAKLVSILRRQGDNGWASASSLEILSCIMGTNLVPLIRVNHINTDTFRIGTIVKLAICLNGHSYGDKPIMRIKGSTFALMFNEWGYPELGNNIPNTGDSSQSNLHESFAQVTDEEREAFIAHYMACLAYRNAHRSEMTAVANGTNAELGMPVDPRAEGDVPSWSMPPPVVYRNALNAQRYQTLG
jgi:hypothetical protein